ncbi:hypothetical protein [Streptomyces tauricus]|uniref:hypothetical protein n=1 Tax=Streptomyces tauricus TaxID=68274 RepID=UPI0033BCD545
MGATVSGLLDCLHPAADEEERRAWAAACVHAPGLGGTAVSRGREPAWFSDSTSARLEDLQFVPGQGPGPLIEGETEVRQVPDPGRLPARQWPQFAAEAEERDIAALFVRPVRIGAVRTGTMTGYRRTQGPLTRSSRLRAGWSPTRSPSRCRRTGRPVLPDTTARPHGHVRAVPHGHRPGHHPAAATATTPPDPVDHTEETLCGGQGACP